MNKPTTADANPLLSDAAIPDFAAIKPSHVGPAIRQLIEETRQELAELERNVAPGWDGLVLPLERLGEGLSRAWGAVGHLMGVRNSDALRTAHAGCQPDVVAISLEVAQSPIIYQAFKTLREGEGWAALDATGQRIVECSLRDARLAGVGLEGAERERFNAIQGELAELSTTFSNNLLDATKAFELLLTTDEQIEGLPDSLLQLAAGSAQAAGHPNATAETGPWRISLDAPCLLPFLKYSGRRDLREAVYRAYVSRASSGELDNSPLIERMLALRLEMAQLLGFEDYAALSLAGKMAPDVAAVSRLLEELRGASWQAAIDDLEDLRRLAAESGAEEVDDLRHWDIALWAERLRQARYGIDDEALRPYFPLATVLEGLFGLANRLFGVRVEAANGEAPIWHPDVRFFRIFDEDDQAIAAFYLDPFSRPEDKRGGAWMDECVCRSRQLGGDAGVQLPVAFLVCNGTPPVGERPSLMSFREVETLAHEFGHGLQHMLTTVDIALASGIRNVEWDAVELPSQFMENWCYHRPTIEQLSGHWQTGEPLPMALFEQLRAARTFRAGSLMLRQLDFSMSDLALHHDYVPGGDRTPQQVRQEIGQRATVLPPLEEDRFLCGFAHIFGGGYAAGYYSYKWAEVLSADAFAAFEEAGLDDAEAVAATGRSFRDSVLALGGSRHPMEVYRTFRGREPSTEALLRHAGLGGQVLPFAL